MLLFLRVCPQERLLAFSFVERSQSGHHGIFVFSVMPSWLKSHMLKVGLSLAVSGKYGRKPRLVNLSPDFTAVLVLWIWLCLAL